MNTCCRRFIAIAALVILAVQVDAVEEADAPAVAGERDSLGVLEAAVARSSKDGAAWVRLGRAYLDAGDLKGAEDAFKKGVRYAKSADAHNGLGLVYIAKGREFERRAFTCFRTALRADPAFIEAQMNIARLHEKLKNPDAGKSFQKAIEMDSTYAPAYLELAAWYWDSGFEDRMADLYKRYIAHRPDDVAGHLGLAMTYTERKRYGEVLGIAKLMQEKHMDDARWLALMAQAHAARGDADRALDLFGFYLRMLSPEERALYEDLSLVATPEEAEAYEETPEAERQAFLDAFWERKDITMFSEGKARLAEHYRRVWVARAYFAPGKAYPWDRRGEVYIRYGEPDYRSRSDRVNPLPSGEVELVKQRKAYELYERGVEYKPDEVPPMYDLPRKQYSDEVTESAPNLPPGWSWETIVGGDRVHLNKPPDLMREDWTSPVFPVDRSTDGTTIIPWESWVYTKVGGGLEFVFVDRMMNGKWDFPIVPRIFHAAMVNQVVAHAPGAVFQTVSSETPEYFDVPPGMEYLEFYYDLASFRGEGEQTAVEVYFGIPLAQITVQEVEGRSLVQVDRSVALADLDGGETYRIQEDLTFAGQAPDAGDKGAFVPDVTPLTLWPGRYRLAVRLADKNSGKWGVYVQEVEIPAFGDTLAISDLEMASMISDFRQPDKFRKGDVWVIPMPSRSYREGRGVYLYYEVYNLRKDEFGQTRYQVSYTIRQNLRQRVGIVGALTSGLERLFRRSRPTVEVSYERAGAEASEPIYFELETGKLKPGLNMVEVRVTDLHAGREVSRKTIFRLDKREEPTGDGG